MVPDSPKPRNVSNDWLIHRGTKIPDSWYDLQDGTGYWHTGCPEVAWHGTGEMLEELLALRLENIDLAAKRPGRLLTEWDLPPAKRPRVVSDWIVQRHWQQLQYSNISRSTQ